jgi:hypothetical protein
MEFKRTIVTHPRIASIKVISFRGRMCVLEELSHHFLHSHPFVHELEKNGNVGSFFEVINRWTDALGTGLALYCKKRFSLFENDKIHFAFVRIP